MGQDVYLAIQRYFHENDIAYREIHHAPGARTEDYHAALGCRYEQQAKCLFLRVTEAESEPKSERIYYAICAIPAQKKANFKTIRRLLNAKDVRFATPEELKSVTGCDLGELAPLGKLFEVPLLMEGQLLAQDEIFMNAGRLNVSFAFAPGELQRVEAPIIFEIPEAAIEP